MNNAVTVRGLHKSFGQVHALNDLDLTVRTGEVTGFLGPNGAGKSTAIRVLLGLLRADAGSVEVLGGDPWRDAVDLHQRLAYVPGEVNLWPNLTGGEAIDLLTRLRRSRRASTPSLPRAGRAVDRDRVRRAELLERFELDPTKKARTYSKGNRQKVALVAALMADVELLILDEPTSGLDPLMESVFTECIREVKAQGCSVLLSSHILAEVEKLCDTVTIIRNGRAVESGTLADLRHLTRTSISAVVAEVPASLAHLEGVHNLQVQGSRLSFDVDDDAVTPALAILSATTVHSLVSAPPSLEDLFLRHYGDELGAPRPRRAVAAVR